MKIKLLRVVSPLVLLSLGGITAAGLRAETDAAAPLELSPAAMEILCERFPLNSRCEGSASPAASEMAPAPEAPVSEMETPDATGGGMTPDAPVETEAPTGDTMMEEMPAETEVEPEASTETTTVVGIASSSDDFSTLTAAIEAAGLTETLSGDGPFTVFAPTNAAFEALPPGTVDTLLKPENKAVLTKILTYHVVPAKAVSTDLSSGDVATVEGSPVKVMVEDSGVKVNEANVVQADIMASNGVVHVIDKVIIPPGLM